MANSRAQKSAVPTAGTPTAEMNHTTHVVQDFTAGCQGEDCVS